MNTDHLSYIMSKITIDDDEMDEDKIVEFEKEENFTYDNDIEKIKDSKENTCVIYIRQIFNLLFLINQNHFSLNVETVDHVVIINDVLFSVKYQCLEIILYLNKSKERIPQKNDKWWNKCGAQFEALMNSLTENSIDLDNFKLKNNTLRGFINLTYQLVINENEEWNLDVDLSKFYNISIYLKNFLIEEFSISIYMQIDLLTSRNNEHMKYFQRKVMQRLSENENEYTNDLVFSALSKIFRGAQNMMILFEPYGSHAFLSEIVNLSVSEIFSLQNDALRYFALHNLILLKIKNKKIHLMDKNKYVNLIFENARFVDEKIDSKHLYNILRN